LEPGSEDRLRYSDLAIELSGREHASPFIYPPLWAKLFGILSTNVDYSLFTYIMAGICACALLSIYEGARHLVDSEINSATALVFQLTFLAGTTIGIVMINELQFQSVVSALIILAFLSAQSQRHMAAGLCLALAASIKLTPLLFIVLWVAQRDYRAIKYFGLFGIALGVASILWAGWPAHQLFLEAVFSLSGDTIIRYTSLSLTAALGVLSSPELMGSFTGNFPDPNTAYQFATPLAVSLFAKTFLIAVLIWIAGWGQRLFADQLYAFGIPVIILTIGLSSPLAWGHHYLAAFAFMPLFYLSTGQRVWMLLFVLGVAATAIYWVTSGLFPRPVVNVAMPILATAYALMVFISLIVIRPR
ncbi:MAG: glycosyltransferase family 87 protein, partial [Pseudomonadota bacterium]